jgi:hypothetical protein
VLESVSASSFHESQSWGGVTRHGTTHALRNLGIWPTIKRITPRSLLPAARRLAFTHGEPGSELSTGLKTMPNGETVRPAAEKRSQSFVARVCSLRASASSSSYSHSSMALEKKKRRQAVLWPRWRFGVPSVRHLGLVLRPEGTTAVRPLDRKWALSIGRPVAKAVRPGPPIMPASDAGQPPP